MPDLVPSCTEHREERCVEQLQCVTGLSYKNGFVQNPQGFYFCLVHKREEEWRTGTGRGQGSDSNTSWSPELHTQGPVRTLSTLCHSHQRWIYTIESEPHPTTTEEIHSKCTGRIWARQAWLIPTLFFLSHVLTERDSLRCSEKFSHRLAAPWVCQLGRSGWWVHEV